MKLIEIKDKDIYNKFVAAQKHSQFLQSWDFNKVLGFRVKVLGLEDDGKLIGAFTLIKKNIVLGKSYYYAPRIGIKNLNKDQLNFLFSEIKKIAKQENILFLRFEPRLRQGYGGQAKFKIKNLKLKIEKTLDIQPSKTLILDIFRSEDELLKNFKQKTRYNIRLAAKKDVVVREMKTEKDFEDWWKIMEETCSRDGFRLHSKKHYQKMLSVEMIRLILAEYEGEIIAGNIVSFFGDMATYVHGASSNKYRNVMAPYLLQWESIKMAKESGCKYYDFYGIDEKKWPGVTRFKLGFNGEEINYPGTFDLVFNKVFYNFYKLLRKIRRLM